MLSNESILGLEKVTAMQKRLSATATMIGINGDFYAPDTGRPSGVLMRDGVVDSPPSGDRSSVGLSPEGSLDIRRVEFFGTWRGLGQRRTLTDMNQAPKQNAISLFTPATAPPLRLRPCADVVLQPFAPAVPNADLTGTVVGFSGVGGARSLGTAPCSSPAARRRSASRRRPRSGRPSRSA